MDMQSETFAVVEIFGRKALFDSGRIDRDDVPDGIYCYDIRHGDDDSVPCSLERFAGVNHFGTVLCKSDFGLQEPHSYIPMDDDTSPNFLDYGATVAEYEAEWTEPAAPLPEVIRLPDISTPEPQEPDDGLEP